MAKYKYKLNLIEFWRVGELESWYSNMAKKGYELVSIGNSFSKFKKVNPQQLKYRIEITKSDELDEEQLHLIEDSGWDYVSSEKQFHVFSSPIERQAPEIHSDPTIQAEAFNTFAIKMKRQAIAASSIAIFMLPIYIAFFIFNESPLYELIIQNNLSMVISFLVIIFLIGYSWHNVYKIFQVNKKLQSGQQIVHDVPFKRLKPIFLIVLFLLLAVYASILNPGNFRTTHINYDETLPIIRLNKFEQDKTLTYVNGLINDIEIKKSLFVAPQIDSSESLRSTSVQYEDGSGLYEPGLWNKYYYLKLPILEEVLFEAVIEKHSYEKLQSDYKLVESKYFDRVKIYEDEYYREVIVLKGRHILKVSYFGMESTVTILATIEEKFKQLGY